MLKDHGVPLRTKHDGDGYEPASKLKFIMNHFIFNQKGYHLTYMMHALYLNGSSIMLGSRGEAYRNIEMVS